MLVELSKFTEKHLPIFIEKWLEWNWERGWEDFEAEDYDGDLEEDFIEKFFPEALQAYTDKVCKTQRENCLGKCPVEMDSRYWDEIKNAPQPKIEDL